MKGGWNTQIGPGEFSLSFPQASTVTTGEAAGAGLLGNALVRIALPPALFDTAKTNLVEAYLAVAVSSLPSALEACTTFADLRSESEPREPKTVHGIEFASRSGVEAAAGNLYDFRVYRVGHANSCYEVAMIVHTGNILNYEPGAVHEFDDERAFEMLERIFETFRLTQPSLGARAAAQ